MLRILFVFIFYFTLLALMAQEGRSFQIWNLNSVQGNLSSKSRIRIAEKVHYTPRADNIDVKFADIFLFRRPNNTFEYGGGFRLTRVDQEIEWLKERRYMVVGKIFNDSEKFEYGFVNRLEYRNFDKAINHFRHKQSFTLQFPEMTACKFRLYTTEETFIKFNSENFHMARLYAGLQTSGLKHLTMKIYYILEKYQRTNRWNTRDILGMNLSIEL